MSHCPCTPSPMYPIAHVAYCPCAPLPYSHVDPEGECATLPICPITPVPHHPCAQSPYPLCSCGLLPMHPIILLPCRSRISHATLPICPITPIPMSNRTHRWWGSKMSNDVKLSKRCQMSKNQISWLWRRFTKKIDILRFTHIDVNFDIRYDGNQKATKCALKVFLTNFGDLHIWCQTWHQYL